MVWQVEIVFGCDTSEVCTARYSVPVDDRMPEHAASARTKDGRRTAFASTRERLQTECSTGTRAILEGNR